MITTAFCIFSVITLSVAENCSKGTAILALKAPIYDFSVRLLDRVSTMTQKHFVYSPLSTWLQLIALAEGAKSATLKEIWNTTGLKGYKKKICYRRKLKEILNEIDNNLNDDTQRSTTIIVDKLYKVKPGFKNEVETLKSAKVISVNFDEPEESAQLVNDLVEEKLRGNLEAVVLPEDFDKTFLVMNDAAYIKSNWKHPFNRAYTKMTSFLYNGIEIGQVNMMNQINHFNYAEIPLINAKVLELPCEHEKISMLIFLPIHNNLLDIFYELKQTSLTGILNKLKLEGLKPMNVSLPAFDIETEVTNVQELLYDMGVKRVFYPETAELKGISDYTISVSLMTQMVGIEVTETGVRASSKVEIENAILGSALEFNANQPFAFMLVDKATEIILFAGIFSNPLKE